MLLREATERGERFDAALLDLSLPWTPGAEASLSTIGLRSIRREGKEAPPGGRFTAFLRKPIKERELLEVIASVIRTAAREQAQQRHDRAPSYDQLAAR
jgi:hypothetical protein